MSLTNEEHIEIILMPRSQRWMKWTLTEYTILLPVLATLESPRTSTEEGRTVKGSVYRYPTHALLGQSVLF